MKSHRPELDAPVALIAEGQREYEQIEAVLVSHPQFEPRTGHITNRRDGQRKRAAWNTVVYAFEPRPDQLEALNRGEKLYIGLLTGGYGPQPLLVLVGKEEAAQVYNVRAT